MKLRGVTRAYERFVRHAPTAQEQSELEVVDRLAGRLADHLDASVDEIDAVHVHRAQSSAVQRVVARLLTDELGFEEEIVLRPESGFITRARPDFIYRLARGRGVLAEVERGGTTTNNHDLKDRWKAHIAHDAQHLFLVVPLSNWNLAGVSREKPFPRVTRRLSAFFGDARREVDVLSVHIFGYGRSA